MEIICLKKNLFITKEVKKIKLVKIFYKMQKFREKVYYFNNRVINLK
jgi:hypothetical protein